MSVEKIVSFLQLTPKIFNVCREDCL